MTSPNYTTEEAQDIMQRQAKDKLLGNAKLRRLEEAIDRAPLGPWRTDHSHLLGSRGELLAEPTSVSGSSDALRFAAQASPDVVRELVRGYRLAQNAGLTEPRKADTVQADELLRLLRAAVTPNRMVSRLTNAYDITPRKVVP